MKISITRALAKLKLLDSKINDATSRGTFASYDVNNETKARNFKPAETFQSINDLIKERAKIKKGIMLSNMTTNVTIGKTTMAVMEAIEYKTSIQYEINLMSKMKNDLNSVLRQIESINTTVSEKADELLKAACGRDTKPSEKDYDAIVKPYKEKNEAKLTPVKGFDIEQIIETELARIEEFINDIDLVLSESNAKTEIEI